jgi:hypothetical protein
LSETALPITVGKPHTLADGTKHYPIVRADGRIVFVLASPTGTAQVGIPRKGGLDWGDPCKFDDAVTVAKAYLRGMK